MKIADIGEQGLLGILHRYCPSEIIGDDAAVLKTEPNHSLVVTTDTLIDGVHFSDRTTSAEDAGWRAVAANLSDLAAMGASPLGITVGLGLPENTCVSWVENLYQGMCQCLDKYSTRMVGGDLVRSPVISINISAFGQVKLQEVILRNKASEGDAIVVTGIHGASAAGLRLLLNSNLRENLSSQECQELIKAHQRPQPRLDVLPTLRKTLGKNSENVIVSGIDSSDGLADAILQICCASKVGAILYKSQISLPNSMIKLLGEEGALNCALYGGEDFELVLCMPYQVASELVNDMDENARIIGKVISTSEVILEDDTASGETKVLSLKEGFQHFA